MAVSATSSKQKSGTLATMMPCSVAAGMSTVSTPIPYRQMTRAFLSSAMTRRVILAAVLRTACASRQAAIVSSSDLHTAGTISQSSFPRISSSCRGGKRCASVHTTLNFLLGPVTRFLLWTERRQYLSAALHEQHEIRPIDQEPHTAPEPRSAVLHRSHEVPGH